MERAVKAAVIHRKRLIREGITHLLSQQHGITVVASAAEAYEILGEITKLRPDVVILDLGLPERDGLGEARQLCQAFPGIKILMLGLSELASDVLACAEAGAAGYLSHETPLEELYSNIWAVTQGEAICSPRVAGLLFSRIAAEARHKERQWASGLIHLTPREREIIVLIEEGLSNKEIAERLQIEIKTVKNHVSNVLGKLQLDSRYEVARYAREQGIHEPYPFRL
jgi:two-component system, NarL family, nitrate/nitrite response regulator NarL